MNKKGQSLIEVVVALGILAIVFAGAVTLIVQIVHLELSARNTTMATTFAQKKLAETVAALEGGCETPALSDPSGSQIIGGVEFSYIKTLTNTFNYSEGLEGANFNEIVIEIGWKNNGLGDGKYIVKQLVQK